MEEKCAACNAIIPEGKQVCPICESNQTTTAPMIWEAIAFCKLQAVGKEGTFTVWKDKKKWKGKYRTDNGLYTCFYGEEKSLSAIKRTCEASKYWEK